MDHIVEVSSRSAPDAAATRLFAPLRAPVPRRMFVRAGPRRAVAGRLYRDAGRQVGLDQRTRRFAPHAPVTSFVRCRRGRREDHPRRQSAPHHALGRWTESGPGGAGSGPPADDAYRVFQRRSGNVGALRARNGGRRRHHGAALGAAGAARAGGPRHHRHPGLAARARPAADFRRGRRRHGVALSRGRARSIGCM